MEIQPCFPFPHLHTFSSYASWFFSLLLCFSSNFLPSLLSTALSPPHTLFCSHFVTLPKHVSLCPSLIPSHRHHSILLFRLLSSSSFSCSYYMFWYSILFRSSVSSFFSSSTWLFFPQFCLPFAVLLFTFFCFALLNIFFFSSLSLQQTLQLSLFSVLFSKCVPFFLCFTFLSLLFSFAPLFFNCYS